MDSPLFWSFLLLAIAIAILTIELFVPSGGLLSLAALGCAIAGIVIAFSVSTSWGLGMIMIDGLIAPLVVMLAVKLWPRTPIGRTMMSRVAGDPPLDVLPDDEHHQKIKALRGRVGIAVTDMLPNGTIEIDGEQFDAVGHGGVVDRGESIEVIRIEAGKIQVRATSRRPEATPRSASDSEMQQRSNLTLDDIGMESLEDPFA